MQGRPPDQRALVVSVVGGWPIAALDHRQEQRFAVAIQRIGDQRRAQRRGVHPDLVRASGLGRRLQQRVPLEALDDLEARHRGFALAHVDDGAMPFVAVHQQRRFDHAFIFLRRARAQRMINLGRLALLELQAERPMGRLGPGEHQHPARVAVQPVDQPDLAQRARHGRMHVVGLAAVGVVDGAHAGRLVHDDDILVDADDVNLHGVADSYLSASRSMKRTTSSALR